MILVYKIFDFNFTHHFKNKGKLIKGKFFRSAWLTRAISPEYFDVDGYKKGMLHKSTDKQTEGKHSKH